MKDYRGTSPLSQQELIDEFFMEYRNKILAVAAFLDRLDRASVRDGEDDFRLRAMRESLIVLTGDSPYRAKEIQMILSDRTSELLEERDRQGALGASIRPEGKEI